MSIARYKFQVTSYKLQVDCFILRDDIVSRKNMESGVRKPTSVINKREALSTSCSGAEWGRQGLGTVFFVVRFPDEGQPACRHRQGSTFLDILYI